MTPALAAPANAVPRSNPNRQFVDSPVAKKRKQQQTLRTQSFNPCCNILTPQQRQRVPCDKEHRDHRKFGLQTLHDRVPHGLSLQRHRQINSMTLANAVLMGASARNTIAILACSVMPQIHLV